MKKILIAMVLVLAMALPAMAVTTAPSLTVKTFNLSANSAVCVSGTSAFGFGSGSTAYNQSIGQVKFSADPQVTTYAGSTGQASTYGFAIGSFKGGASATGNFSGIVW